MTIASTIRPGRNEADGLRRRMPVGVRRRTPTLRDVLVVVVALGAVGCLRSREPRDAWDGSIPTDPGVQDAGSTDATDADVDIDAAAYPCYPVDFSYVLQGTPPAPLRVGDPMNCDGFGFVATAAEKNDAESIGATCTAQSGGDQWCLLAWPAHWIVAESDYDQLCPVETAFGPRTWICVLYE